LKEECDRRMVRVAVGHVVKLLRYELTYFDRPPVDAGHRCVEGRSQLGNRPEAFLDPIGRQSLLDVRYTVR